MPSKTHPKLRVAAVQAAPVFLDVDATIDKTIRLMQEASRQGALLIELRLDMLKKAPDFIHLLEKKPCPMVATVRRPHDGGMWDLGEPARRMILRQAIVAGFDWDDLENDVIDAKTLPKIKMPNRDGFVKDPRPDIK